MVTAHMDEVGIIATFVREDGLICFTPVGGVMPGVLTGGLMAFTMSLDDFVISYFTKGSGFQTLPLYIYSMTKKTVTPKIYALATLIFLTILILLFVTNAISARDARRQARMDRALHRNTDPVS